MCVFLIGFAEVEHPSAVDFVLHRSIKPQLKAMTERSPRPRERPAWAIKRIYRPKPCFTELDNLPHVDTIVSARKSRSGRPTFMTRSQNALVVLGCSATKFQVDGEVPAVHLYDGPMFRVFRSRLRTHKWSKELSVGVLSAKYGLIGAVAPIETYDQRMTADRAAFLRQGVSSSLAELSATHKRVHLVLGHDYRDAIDHRILESPDVECVDGPIGMKLHLLSNLLASFVSRRRDLREVSPSRGSRAPLYFLPDWDDFLDVDFDFRRDQFSATDRSNRKQAHSIELMRPQRICDGILVSLAQHLGSKGILRRLPPSDPQMLRPRSVRDHFGLSSDQWAFGDCGAFSYAAQHDPAISVEKALAIYELYDFDLGASVDHIPLAEVVGSDGNRKELSPEERARRVKLTKSNAAEFISLWKSRGCTFTPVGVIQAVSPRGYARQVHEYLEMGYDHIALGGLVPRSDEEIRRIILAVTGAVKSCRQQPWIHLLGVFRPRLQETYRTCSVQSFDSASYFRKAWLRSDQNYLGHDGQWYAALRIPPTSDARTLKRLKESGKRESTIKQMEKDALAAVRRYDAGTLDIDSCLATVLAYDRLLDRGGLKVESLRDHYRKTLEGKAWQGCTCNICKAIGVEVMIFRGYNRNKRRGAHNTLKLFEAVKSKKFAIHTSGSPTSASAKLSE
jgi:hypothetical protein